MQRKPLAVATGLLFVAIAAPTRADTLPLLDQIVVTASRLPERRAEVAGDVSVLTRADIERAGQATLTELLATLPGVEITRNGGAGAVTSVFLRGANRNHSLVLVDGVRMTSASLGSARLEHLPLELVERIEVVRGPMSTLYGSEAIGGVIQIFTRRGGGAPRAHVRAGLGGLGLATLDAGLTGGADGLRYALSVGHAEQDGQSASNPDAGPWTYNPDKDGYRNRRAALSLEYDLDARHVLSLRGLASDGLSQFDDGLGFSGETVDSRARARLGNAGVGLTSRLGADWTSSLRADYAYENVRTHGNGYASHITLDQWQLGWQLDGRTAPGDWVLLLERLDQKVGGDVGYARDRRERDAILLGWRRDFGRHRLHANARHDDDSQFGGHATGGFGYGLRLTPAWRAELAWGSAYRAPAFDDLYWPGGGNPELRPETARNLEAAVKHQAGDRLVSATVYRNRVEDLIQWAPGPGGNWRPDNIAHADLRGLTLAWRDRLGDFDARASVDFQRAEDADTGQHLPLRARRHASLGLDWRAGAWTLSADLVARDARYADAGNSQRLPGHVVIDLGARYRIDRDWSIDARLANALDVDYQLARGYDAPGRNLFVAVAYAPR